MDRAGDRLYTTGPKLFFQRSQRCSDRVNTCQTPRRALSTSRTSQHPTWDFIAVTISKPPAHDVAISLLATHPASALCTTLAIYAPVARLTSWCPTRLTTVPHVGSISTSICPMSPHPAVITRIG